jgi:hypothetical protein
MTMKLNVFGRVIEVVRHGSQWRVFYPGNEGKKRPATDIILPDDLGEENLLEYIADLCHEWATPNNSEVRRLD